ncbi:hypothetical protein [Herbaspirillum huttiense]|uniref:hypothetical protein n=1 Tax=Herbaspirillum huttiense TaxID=863372 RepID=UPI0039B03204
MENHHQDRQPVGATTDQANRLLEAMKEARARVLEAWRVEASQNFGIWKEAAAVILETMQKHRLAVALRLLQGRLKQAGKMAVCVYYERAVSEISMFAEVESEINKIRFGSLDSYYGDDALSCVTRLGTRQQVDSLVAGILAKARSFERVQVTVWHSNLLYLQVIDTRLDYPRNLRLNVTVDAITGEPCDPRTASKHHNFYRRGWGSFMTALVGSGVPNYGA